MWREIRTRKGSSNIIIKLCYDSRSVGHVFNVRTRDDFKCSR